MDIVAKAAAFAKWAHKGQTRKYTGEPYFNHCEDVATLCVEQRCLPTVVAAAYLHDVVEDCGVMIEQIAMTFGHQIADLVRQVTDISVPQDGNRKVRKAKDRDHLATATPDGKTIKLADIISNTASIVERDPSFAAVYLREKRELLPLLREGNAALYERAALILGSQPLTGGDTRSETQ